MFCVKMTPSLDCKWLVFYQIMLKCTRIWKVNLRRINWVSSSAEATQCSPSEPAGFLFRPSRNLWLKVKKLNSGLSLISHHSWFPILAQSQSEMADDLLWDLTRKRVTNLLADKAPKQITWGGWTSCGSFCKLILSALINFLKITIDYWGSSAEVCQSLNCDTYWDVCLLGFHSGTEFCCFRIFHSKTNS